MSPWAVLMMPKSASLSASIYYLSYQINLINNLLASIDDGLVLLRNTSKQKTERIRKDIIEIFKNSGFKIEIKTNLRLVDFFGRNV